ncbi:MAG: hypothetical protein AMXMBFR53_41570 [Gemmatimonadota bacterium]
MERLDIDAQEPIRHVALSHEVSALLLDLAIGVHHFAMYPTDHPFLEPAVDAVVGRLAGVFLERRTFTLGVADRQLVVDGAATDPSHPALSELATRLHKHQLGAVTFNRGIAAKEVKEILGALASDVDISGIPLGLLSPDEFPTWENARLFRIGYEDLELRDGGTSGPARRDRATALWLGLARLAMPEESEREYGPEGNSLAARVRRHPGGVGEDDVAEYAHHLAYELRGARGNAAEEIRRRFSEFLERLDAETLDRIVHFSGNRSRCKRFLLDANQSLTTDAVLRLVQAAAHQSGQGISQAMTRLLGKFAVHAERGAPELRPMADTAVRDNVEALLRDWDLKDPNPEAYTLELDAMSRAAPVFQAPDAGHQLAGAGRLIQMAVEVDADGPVLDSAVNEFLESNGVGPLLDLLALAPPDNRVGERILSSLATPTRLRLMLAKEHLDPRSLKTLVERIGPAAADPLLDAMEDSESRAVRRLSFDALADMGPSVAPEVVERLRKGEWFVQRNSLSLLQRFAGLPEGLDVGPYLEHGDPRVRRAALPLALRSPELRDTAVRRSLADDDAYVLRAALLELRESASEDLQRTVIDRVLLNGHRSDDLRALAARIVANAGTPGAKDALLRVVVVGRTLFGRPKLAPRSPLSLAALRALAQGWPDEADVRAVIRRARSSKDPEFVAAVARRGGRPPGDEGETAA